MTCRQQRERLVRFLKDFVTFRLDLAYYQVMYHAMNQIQLLDDPAHIKLSRANYTLTNSGRPTRRAPKQPRFWGTSF